MEKHSLNTLREMFLKFFEEKAITVWRAHPWFPRTTAPCS